MSDSIRPAEDGYYLARGAAMSLMAVAVAVYAFGLTGLANHIVFLAVVLAGLGLLLFLRVRHAVFQLDYRSKVVLTNASAAERHYIDVLTRIVKVVESRDRFWAGHSDNVGRLAGMIAREMGLSEDECEQLVLAGQLHDIGLLAVPESVMLNHSRFGVDEFQRLQAHSRTSYETLKPLEMLSEVLPAIRSHHEKLNGTGYPDGLQGDQIPLGGRILAVADAYDAMTHDRPHRQAMSSMTAMRELRRCTPEGYDPACVEALARCLSIPAIEAVSARCEPAMATA